ncbi:MAG: peptide-methionine (S)-S-oxide reductase MsrA [Candidatus Saccharibacteria bacterium]
MVEPITESAILGGGCFWCLDAAFREISGIENVICGYSGGQWPDPSYERVSAGTTGHAEVVEVFFDPEIISYTDVLDIFWVIHDPTTKNAQGHDIGSQYRSIILYQSEEQKVIAAGSIAEIAKLWPNPVVTELLPLEKFYPAEDYHQEYFAKNPGQGYCVAVINPKLVKIREKFKARLKS